MGRFTQSQTQQSQSSFLSTVLRCKIRRPQKCNIFFQVISKICLAYQKCPKVWSFTKPMRENQLYTWSNGHIINFSTSVNGFWSYLLVGNLQFILVTNATNNEHFQASIQFSTWNAKGTALSEVHPENIKAIHESVEKLLIFRQY